MLRVLFQRQPLARAGWEALTPTQRRHHLLGIFYYETADARERRAAKAVEVALKAAGRAKDQTRSSTRAPTRIPYKVFNFSES